MRYFLTFFSLLMSQVAMADAPVIWDGTNVKWLNSGLHVAGMCKTDAAGVQTAYTTNGIIKMSSGVPGAASAGVDYEVPLTFSSGVTRTVNAVTCDVATGAAKGCLTAADWTTFNGKQAAISIGAFSAAPTAQGLTLSGAALNMDPADATHPGGVSVVDWNTFNNKQPAGSYITALTGEVTASGPGSVAATVSNAAVIAKLLTGFTSGAGTVTASDSILPAIQKLDGNIALELPSALPDGQIYIGSALGVATPKAMSGDATLINTGAITLKNTGPGAGSYTSADITIDAQGRITAAANGGSGGGCVAPVLTKTTTYVLLTADFTCANKIINIEMNCSSDCTLTLPAASNSGYEARVINVGAAQATVSTAGSDTFGTSAATTWVMQASPSAPQTGNLFWANGGTRWNGQ